MRRTEDVATCTPRNGLAFQLCIRTTNPDPFIVTGLALLIVFAGRFMDLIYRIVDHRGAGDVDSVDNVSGGRTGASAVFLWIDLDPFDLLIDLSSFNYSFVAAFLWFLGDPFTNFISLTFSSNRVPLSVSAHSHLWIQVGMRIDAASF